MTPVYLDHNATTPLDPRVTEAMLPWLGGLHGNASSTHSFGRAAREAVEAARAEVAALLGCRPLEIVLCASGTEANNAVIASCAAGADFSGHLVISGFEHPSVTAAAERLEEGGMEVTRVAPDAAGRVPAGAVADALRRDTRLVCLMLANNEVGTVQPVAEVAAACRERGVPVLCDAVQCVGKIPVRTEDLGVDFVVIGAHKFYGPLGAAALRVRGGVELRPLLVGGGQERRRRAGTVNVAAVVGMGSAARLAAGELAERGEWMRALRDRFESGLEAIGDVAVHGAGAPRLPNTSNIALFGVQSEALAIRLDLAGFCVSTGSACASGAVEPSSALKAMGVADEEALSSLRISFGKDNNLAEVEAFLGALAREVAALRRLAGAASR